MSGTESIFDHLGRLLPEDELALLAEGLDGDKRAKLDAVCAASHAQDIADAAALAAKAAIESCAATLRDAQDWLDHVRPKRTFHDEWKAMQANYGEG